MKVIDLSQKLFDQMPVYPGDPEVEIKQVHSLAEEGWNLRTLFLTTHIGTHVNVPVHMVEDGKNLDEVSLDRFSGPARLYNPDMKFSPDEGVLFLDQNIDDKIAAELIANPPKFVGLSADREFDVDFEKKLLEHDIISFENLENLDQLPEDEAFQFYGLPLRIAEADGSPVRAVAVFD